MDLQMFCVYLPVLVAVCLALLVLARYLSHGESDSTTQVKLDESQRLNEESGIEAYRIRETATESKKSVDVIRERESEARKSVELAESAVGEAHQDNRRAEDILKECLEIIEEAEKERENISRG
jgi:hypothetical protein